MTELSKAALQILQKRYLLRNKEGILIETPEQLWERVANALAEPEGDNKEHWAEIFKKMI